MLFHQQVSFLCLLDLHTAFYCHTLDHSILLHRLSSWFGLSSLSLQFFHITLVVSHTCRCHPTSSFFLISYPLWCPKRLCTWSHSFQSSYYTFQFSLISSSTVSQVRYADDTQLLYPSSPNKVFSGYL